LGKLARAAAIAALLIGLSQIAYAQTASHTPTAHHEDLKPAATATTPTAPAPETSVPPPPVDATPSPGSGYGRLFGLIFGLIVAGGVVWIVLRLIRSRGQVLIDLARKAGVEVPNLDDPIPLAATAASPEYKPKPPIEKIPDEATRPPVIPSSPPRPAVSNSARSGNLRIVAEEGVASGSTFALSDEKMSIGRDGDNDLVLADPTVSRHHAIITRDAKGTVTIEDGGSSNGIVINGERVDHATLSPGDQFKIGDNYFRLEGT